MKRNQKTYIPKSAGKVKSRAEQQAQVRVETQAVNVRDVYNNW